MPNDSRKGAGVEVGHPNSTLRSGVLRHFENLNAGSSASSYGPPDALQVMSRYMRTADDSGYFTFDTHSLKTFPLP